MGICYWETEFPGLFGKWVSLESEMHEKPEWVGFICVCWTGGWWLFFMRWSSRYAVLLLLLFNSLKCLIQRFFLIILQGNRMWSGKVFHVCRYLLCRCCWDATSCEPGCGWKEDFYESLLAVKYSFFKGRDAEEVEKMNRCWSYYCIVIGTVLWTGQTSSCGFFPSSESSCGFFGCIIAFSCEQRWTNLSQTVTVRRRGRGLSILL